MAGLEQRTSDVVSSAAVGMVSPWLVGSPGLADLDRARTARHSAAILEHLRSFGAHLGFDDAGDSAGSLGQLFGAGGVGWLSRDLPAHLRGSCTRGSSSLRLPLSVVAPVVWVGVELSRGYGPLGFSMALLAHTQVKLPLLSRLPTSAGPIRSVLS